jgi:phosphatidylserine/phosphatidylglycerophosphate/cardiolipin synthase-like enzyme
MAATRAIADPCCGGDRAVRAQARRPGGEGRSLFGSGEASLHIRPFVADGELTFVGSLNLDPRSANLNTEVDIFAEDPELAERLREEYERLTDPARSWSVGLRMAGRVGVAMLKARCACCTASLTRV